MEGQNGSLNNYLSKYLSRILYLRTVLVYGVLQDLSRSNIVLWAKAALEKGKN